MYQVSEDFIEQINKHTRIEHVRGMIGTVSFNDSNVMSMTVNNRCSDTSDVTFGSAYIGQLDATFVNVAIPRGFWRDQTITLEWGIVLEDESVEWIPVGVFDIASAEWSDVGVTVKANDRMAKLDRTFSAIQTSASSLYSFAAYACSECDVDFDLTAEECQALPNGDQIIGLYPENDIKTWRDLMSWLGQIVGGFVTATRDGKITIRSFADSDVVDEWGVYERVVGSMFSDYTTLYDGISIVNIADSTLSYYSAGDGEGSAIKLGSNPFLQYGTDFSRDSQRQTVAQVAHMIDWTPFRVTTLSNLIYDLGDLIECTGGVAGTGSLTCGVMCYEWTFKNTTVFQGYGADPSLSSGQSKTDKNLSGLLSKVKENEIQYYRFQNVEDLSLGENDPETIASVTFAAENPTNVDVWLEVKLDAECLGATVQVPVYDEEEVIDPETGEPVIDPDTGEPETEIVQIGWWDDVEGDMTAHVRYYYDGNLIGYEPIDTFSEEGFHILHLGYFIPNVTNTGSHTFVATLEMGNAEAEIASGDITLVLKGQGLVASEQWDGEIVLDDSVGRYDVEALLTHGIDDGDPTVEVATPITKSFTDETSRKDVYELGKRNLDEDIEIILRNLMFNIVTEDGEYNFITEDGDYNIVTEYT